MLHGMRTFCAPGRGRPDQGVAFHLCRTWTIRASGPNTPGWPRSVARSYEPITDAEAMDAFSAAVAHRGDRSGASSRRTAWPERSHLRSAAAGNRRSGERAVDPGQPCPAAATRTWTPRSSGSVSTPPVRHRSPPCRDGCGRPLTLTRRDSGPTAVSMRPRPHRARSASRVRALRPRRPWLASFMSGYPTVRPSLARTAGAHRRG